MNRSKWKGPFFNKHNTIIAQSLKKKHGSDNLNITRNTTILPKFIDQTFKIYNGKKFNEIIVTEEMIGHKFGEFSLTRKRFLFKKKVKK